MELFITLAQNLLIGYGGATILFLIITLCYSPFRALKNAYLSISNVIAMVIGVLLAIAIAWNYLIVIPHAVDDSYFRYPKMHIALIVILTGIIPLLFLYDKYRKNIVFTLLMATLMTIGCFYERIFYFITSFFRTFRDHLPSSWAYYRGSYMEIISWPLGYFLVMLILASIKMKLANAQLS